MVSGHGFLMGEIVLINFRGHLVQSAQADHRGTFANAAFVVGVDVPFGSYTVQAVGSNSGRSAGVKVKVTPVLGPKPSSGVGIAVSAKVIKPGQSVTVTGHGFQAGEYVLIRLHGAIVQAVAADKKGNFKASFRVANNVAKGGTSVEATGARSNRQAQVKVVVA